MLNVLILIAAAVIIAAPAWAEDIAHGELVITEPWSRATPAGAGVGAGYMLIRNEGETADRLVGGTAPFAGRIEIHEMAMTDGVMRMRALDDGLEIAPGESVTLEPGGYHVMFMELVEPLVEGEARAVTLEFAEAGPLELIFDVRSIAARAEDHRSHSAN